MELPVLFLSLCAATVCRAETALVPAWLPEDQRLEVEGASNEIAQVEQTLALMCDSLHPKLRAMMKEGDLGPTLEWIVHISQPGAATNETVYLESYRKPLLPSAFDANLLTNRAAHLSIIPTRVIPCLVYDDGKRDSVPRAMPGVDYPGVSYEDEGSTINAIVLTLRAPKWLRKFKVNTSVPSLRPVGHEVKWAVLRGTAYVPKGVAVLQPGACGSGQVGAIYTVVKNNKETLVAVFAREIGGLWGPPSYIRIAVDPLCVHTYADRQIVDIDYGTFRDWYKVDGEKRIYGFTRILPGQFRGDEYSNFGEKILETYPDDKPKKTRKVKYSIRDGKLFYRLSDEEIQYKNGPFQYRPDLGENSCGGLGISPLSAVAAQIGQVEFACPTTDRPFEGWPT